MPARLSRSRISTAKGFRTSPSTACSSWTAERSPRPGRARRCAVRDGGQIPDAQPVDFRRDPMTPNLLAAMAALSTLWLAAAEVPRAGREAMKETATKLEAELVGKYGESERGR